MPDASVSAHVDEEFLAEFDETFDCGPGRPRSRSDGIEHAMKWAVAMERARADRHRGPDDRIRAKRRKVESAEREEILERTLSEHAGGEEEEEAAAD